MRLGDRVFIDASVLILLLCLYASIMVLLSQPFRPQANW